MMSSLYQTAECFGLVKRSEEPGRRARNYLLAGTALAGGAAFGAHRLLRAGKARPQALQGGVKTFTPAEFRPSLFTPAAPATRAAALRSQDAPRGARDGVAEIMSVRVEQLEAQIRKLLEGV